MSVDMNALLSQARLQENRLLRWLNQGLQLGAVRVLMVFASRLGDGVLWFTLCCLLLCWQGMAMWPALLSGALSIGLCLTLFMALKRRTTRPRPFEVMTGLRTAIAPIDQWSFPSGHAINAFCVAMWVQLFFPALAVGVWPMATLIAISRIALGLHYPSDVLSGAILGAVIAAASGYLVLLLR